MPHWSLVTGLVQVQDVFRRSSRLGALASSNSALLGSARLRSARLVDPTLDPRLRLSLSLSQCASSTRPGRTAQPHPTSTPPTRRPAVPRSSPSARPPAQPGSARQQPGSSSSPAAAAARQAEAEGGRPTIHDPRPPRHSRTETHSEYSGLPTGPGSSRPPPPPPPPPPLPSSHSSVRCGPTRGTCASEARQAWQHLALSGTVLRQNTLANMMST